MNEFKTAGILLAAGMSSRMGQLKALLPWEGRTLIQYQIEQMKKAGTDEIIVILGYQAERLQNIISAFHVKTVINEKYEQGKSSSIRKGISSLQEEAEGIFISAVDQPVPAGVLNKMIKHLKETGAAAVIPIYKNKRGHPILFHESIKNDLLLINEETLGLRGVISKFQQQTAYLDVNDPSVLFNFNKPEEYFTSDRRLQMKVSEIDVVTPKSVKECLYFLSDKEKRVRLLAGGTDAVVRMKDGIGRPETWINIKGMDSLRYIREESDGIHIGPLTTHTDIIRSALLWEKADVLASASNEVGGIQIQNMGTIGGNLGTASPAGDTIPPLFVLDAQIELSSLHSKRIVPITEFFNGPGNTVLQPGEMITNIIIRPQAENEIGIFEKLGPRKAQSISIVNVAISLKMGEGPRECLEGKIAFGSAGPTIIRAAKCERMLSLGPLYDNTIRDIADIAWKEVMPITDGRATAKYRRSMASALLARGLYRLMKRWDEK
ncbi:FAD binding domain-containing protein [Siminovitchia fortis]|uniref:FAD-binding PCMH-type domain-containing protein n=1 Tax=Siminovitchia fortis TaxID=254758 RepID=A0A443IU76_9BACI|nr:FAD binding domain-containing protein [Siminovitchia fortis]RWR11648.1 hypothetical protein D4N35_008295 [Siminovitchia fortis]WHY83224.1 FAD binding domain-containing protein [Siminovitchia fortis]